MDEIIGVGLHFGEPVDDEFVVFLRGEAEGGEGLLEKRASVAAFDDEALGHIVGGA